MKEEGIWIVVILLFCVVGFFYLAAGPKNNTSKTTSVTTSDRTLKSERESSSISTSYTYKEGTQPLDPDVSTYKDMVRMSVYDREDLQNEYVILYADNNNSKPINITGWKIRSRLTNNTAVIPRGVELYNQNGNILTSIILNPGDQATIATIPSPVGVSFKINKCSGYLSQNRYFAQRISSNCPTPSSEEIPIRDIKKNLACYDYTSSLPRCKTPLEASFPEPDSPDVISSDCKTFIESYFSYNSCVIRYSGLSNFYSDEWRVYLGGSSALWQERNDKIDLIDQNGKIIDSIEY